MAQSMFRHGQRELVQAGVLAATVIARGDMVALQGSDDNLLPASGINWDSDEATTQATFANIFLGIAYEGSTNSQSDDISVDISADAVYEFDVDSAVYELGEDLGPGSAASLLLDQTLSSASAATSAIARSFEEKASAATRIKMKFASAYNVSANNVNSQVG